MIYKRDRKTIGDERNRLDYLDENPMCECCRKQAGQIHHHIPQQFRHLGETYVIDLFDNYSTLGTWCCHGIIEHNEKQYYSKGLDVKSGKPYSYWHELKSGKDPHELIEEYLAS